MISNPYQIIIRPVVTEKSYKQAHGTAWQSRKAESAASIRWYAFEVDPRATKHQIREAVEKLFEVKVTGVHTMHVHPRSRRVRTRAGLTKAWKKALVRISAQSKAIEGF